MFWSKTIIPKIFRNASRIILEGAENVLGPSRIFLERTRAKNIMSPDGGQDLTNREECFMGWFGGGPWGHPSLFGGECFRGGGAPMRGHCSPRPRVGGPHQGASSPFWWVAFWKGWPPFGPSSSSLPPSLYSPINRGGEGSPLHLKFLTTKHAMICHSLSPSAK